MKLRVIETILAVLVSIPIIVAKVKSADVKDNVREPYVVIEAETETETISEFIPYYNYSFMAPVSIETERQFSGYPTVPLSVDEQRTIKKICDRYNVAFELMMAIAKQESYFNMTAHNPISDDYGMFQINENTWNDTAINLGLYDYRTDLIENTEIACYIIRICIDTACGDLRIALNYYRTGTPNNKYEANSDYASIIMNNINEIIGEI